jgi:hypothetical protein
MDTIKCNQCSADLPVRGFFCPACGCQVKCKHCNDLLEPNAKACVSCGTLVIGLSAALLPSTSAYPSLIAIAMKNLPTSEAEWIVVYSFYASKYGTGIFTRKDLIAKYEESKRKTAERVRDMGAYIKRTVQSGYINPLGETFSILDAGIEHAKAIIGRTTGITSKPKVLRKSKDAKLSKTDGAKKMSLQARPLKRLSNIDFEPNGKESLNEFNKKFAPESDLARNLLFVFYMQDILNISAITIDHIYTCYDALDLRVSENLPQTIRNTKSKKGWIETQDTANITVTIKGRNQVKSWSKNPRHNESE